MRDSYVVQFSVTLKFKKYYPDGVINFFDGLSFRNFIIY